MGKAETVEMKRKHMPVYGTRKLVQDICIEREVTPEEVLAAIVDTLAEDYLHQLPRDEAAIDTPYGQQAGVSPVMTALLFRRLMQRMCAANLKLAERVDDPALSLDEWSKAEGALGAGLPQAAACDLFDAVTKDLAEQIRVEKEEAAMLGKADPHPTIQFAQGSTTEAMLVEPPAKTASDGAAGKTGKTTAWN